LINNRQGGRRRGRGGQRGPNPGGQPGNRQDNRQRGNAAQLLEKYKSMARDAQLAGDRVQTEYFLQYADHYFRVLSENRSRFEEQRPRREHEIDEDEGDEEFVEAEEVADERPQRQERNERFNRERRPRREERNERNERNTREDSEGDGAGPNSGETIPFDVLPPAIGREEPTVAESGDEAPRRPRRRTRAARPTEGEDEIAPAA
jgi:hypothetical protein